MPTTWNELYTAALEATNPIQINEHFCIGSVGAAVLSGSGKVYTGICIDTACSLGMCAERNALSTMLTQGEFSVQKVVAVNSKGTILPPCGACREFMLQLSDGNGEAEVMVAADTVVPLKELMPHCYK